MEFRFYVVGDFGVDKLLDVSEEFPVGHKIGVLSALNKKEYLCLNGILKKPRHNGVTKKISAQTEFSLCSSTALLKSFEASRDDKSEPITAQALLAVEAQAGIVNDYGAVR